MILVCRAAVDRCAWLGKHVGKLAAMIAILCMAGVCPFPCEGQTWNWPACTSGGGPCAITGNVGIGITNPNTISHR